MPMITIKWVKREGAAMRKKVVSEVTDTIHRATGIPKPDIWVIIEDVSAEDWYTGAETVAAQRAAAAKKKGT